MAYYDSFRAARWIRFINLVLQALLFLTLFAGLNYIALNHTWGRFDLTESRRHSLSAETRSYLDRLERDIRIIVTISNDGTDKDAAQAYRDISGLLREYTYHTRNNPHGKVGVRFIDVYQNRKEAEDLQIDRPNQVVLLSDNHRRVLSMADFYSNSKNLKREAFRGEAVLTAALLDVSTPVKKRIYFLSGHGELQPNDVDRRRGLSDLRDQLQLRNYEVVGLDLSLTRKIPDDASLVVIAGPQGQLQPFEEELLRNFLTTRAGRLILLIDYGVLPGLENLLFDWGIRVFDNVIIDPDLRSITENNDMRLWGPGFIRDSASHITDNLIDGDLSIICGPARVVTDDLSRSLDDGLSVKKLITTSPSAWGETSYRLKSFEYTPDQDLKGALSVMVISERLKPANLDLSVKGGRLAVIGTSDLVTNDRIINVGNLSLFLATVNWTINRDTQLNIPVRPIQRFQLALSAEELVQLRLGLLLGVPGLVALIGIAVYWTRRN
jgi:ABC-type uncharacterized transport system involved in gliding motility auxiliary subunit